MVEWSNTRTVHRLAPVRISLQIGDRRIGRSAPEPSFIIDPGSNPSNHKLLTPTPTPKNDIQFQGDTGLKIKKSIGGLFCRAK